MQDRADERARLSEALERANARIAALAVEIEQEKQVVAKLQCEMAELDEAVLVSASPIDETTSIRAPAEKQTIFRSLFRERPDVYPTRFVSREGKQGYGPACANKFVKGVCELPLWVSARTRRSFPQTTPRTWHTCVEISSWACTRCCPTGRAGF